MERHDVTFRSGNDHVAAWWYPCGPGRRSCVVMSHGFGATKRSGLAPFAERFAGAGHHVLVIDYRYFGDSGGQPRRLVDPQRQVDDVLAAAGYARSREDVDPTRIALWGSSFGGGIVLAAAVRDRRVAAAISQCPAMDGVAAFRQSLGQPGETPITSAKFVRLVVADWVAAASRRSATHIPIAGPPGSVAVLTAPDALPGYRSIAGSDFVNSVCARTALKILRFRPVTQAHRVPCPWLVQICQQDSVAPPSSAMEAARRAGARADVRRYDIGHFDIYVDGGFERAVADQIDFLHRHVPPGPQPEA